MSGANNVQANKTPRARHSQSKSGAAPVSDSDGINAQSTGGKKKGNRRNNQARTEAQQPPAWQDNNQQQPEGFFDIHGNFVSAQQYYNDQVTGGLYPNGAQNNTGANGANRKQRNPKNRVNGTGTPPRAISDNEQIFAATAMYNMTPAKTAAAAYAGPTFHASPAPSALPIPKFFSKSVPNDPAQAGLQARLDQEPEKSDSSEKSESPPTAQAMPSIPVPDRPDESPLDFLFKADKEQKAKRQSAGFLSTPPAKPHGQFLGTEPARAAEPARANANPWQSIYGTGPRNHQRHASSGSGKDLFMLELDASESSPKPKKLTPPSLPRLPNRSKNGQNIVQLPSDSRLNHSPRRDFYGNAHGNSMPSLQPSFSDPQPFVDGSHSPFNRPAPYPTPRSADSTPQPHQNGIYNSQNNLQNSQHSLHYGNRNLSPLFKAAKQDLVRPASSLRQEVHPTSPQVAELPDSSPSRPLNGPRRTSSKADQAAMAFLQTQVPNPPSMPHIPLPRVSPLSELDGQPSASAPVNVTAPTLKQSFNAKSAEDDLKRLLKLTGGVK